MNNEVEAGLQGHIIRLLDHPHQYFNPHSLFQISATERLLTGDVEMQKIVC